MATRPHRLRRPPAEALTDSGRARRPSRTRAHRPTRGLPALPGRRVRHRLTPTGPGRSRPTMAPKSPIGDAAPHPCRGEALPRPPAPPARQTRWHASTTPPIHPAPCPSHHPGIAGPHGPAGQAPPDPYATGRSPTRAGMPRTGQTRRNPCRGEALPRPPALTARRFRVADTSRTTRIADQQSGPLHDRPAVHGRAQSPSRLKPADPNGQPIDSGAWAPHSPLQGAWGFSPGLQPRAHGWRPPPP